MADQDATLLIVDDNPTKRYVIGSWLRRAGYRLAEAATGGEALDLLAAEPIDLVVLDVRLPDLSGFEVCERIKAAPATASVPVVHISATAIEASDRTHGLTRGADAYLSEPIDPDELVATVQALLRYFRARQRAERLAERLAGLAETTIAVNQAQNFTDLLTAAAVGTARVFDRPAAIAAVTPDASALIAHCGGAGRPAVASAWMSADERADQDARTASALSAEAAARWPELAEVPAGTGLWVSMARPRPTRSPAYVVVPAGGLNADDAHVLTQLAQAVALALDSMRALDEERRIALTLQHSLLPRRLPEVNGVDLAVRYVPASEHAEIGGDFYELLFLGGVLCVAVGDVAGHSLHAATIMAELRHALRAYLAEGHGPSAVIDRLNSLMMRLLPDETATLCLITLDVASGEIRLSNAGHLPPVLAVPGAEPGFISSNDALLGVDLPRGDEVCTHLPPGATLLVVTDGLVERRGELITDGLEALRRACRTVEPDLGELCDRLLRTFVPGSNEDDVAILALRRRLG